MKPLFFTVMYALFCGHMSALCGSVLPARNQVEEKRAADTCADPSTSIIYVEAYGAQWTLHILRPRSTVIHQDTVSPSADFEIQEEAFRGWRTPDPNNFTVPLYEIGNPGGTDWMYAVSTTGPPVVSGYPNVEVLAYVYETQVCGSLPLMHVEWDGGVDRYFTTYQDEHDDLIALGWVDKGIVAYVLPVDID